MRNEVEIQARNLTPVAARRRLTPRIERFVDLAVSFAVLSATAPIWAVIALAIKLDSRGPIIYRQRRVGFEGREFVMYKFRSMKSDARSDAHETAFEKYANGESVDEDEEGTLFKAVRDPRVTRIGHFLRISDLDEIPQFINVIKGEMSIVGPRPAIPYELKWYEEWHHKRFTVLPGITGLWQLKDRVRIEMRGMMLLDLEYIRRRNVIFDLKIMALTGKSMLKAFIIAVGGKRSKS